MQNLNINLNTTSLIYIDTSSLMNVDSFIQFVEANKDYLHLNEQKIIILGAIHFELNNLLKSEYVDRKMLAKKALDYIYLNKYLFDIRKRDEYECFGDHTLQVEILKNRKHKSQILITEDRKLAIDIYKFNDIESSDGKQINIFSLNQNGRLYFPKYLDLNSKDELTISTIDENIILEEVNTNLFTKEISAFIGGTLSGLILPFVFKKLKSYF